MQADFSGYATRNNIRCSDGRTIMRDAFAGNDGTQVPLVYQHDHQNFDNVLGHCLLENRDDGVYCYGFLNDSEQGKMAKEYIRHGDITALSIYANHLKQNGDNVVHGEIKEVSLVLAGANPGAFIDNVSIAHSDGTRSELDDEAIIYGGVDIEHADGVKIDDEDDVDDSDEDYVDDSEDVDEDDSADTEDDLEEEIKEGEKAKKLKKLVKKADSKISHADSGKTVGEIIDGMTEEEQGVLYGLLGQALESQGQNENESAAHSAEGDNMHKNAFEQNGSVDSTEGVTLSHDDVKNIMKGAERAGSMKVYMNELAHAQTYGITNIDVLFPDAQKIRNTPDFYKRRTEWVNAVLNSATHVPFSRIKSMYADITTDEARARGYTLDRENNHRKIEEVFNVLKRVTTPQTIYKKQKLDRDDITDITDFDVVAWLKVEMRVMLDEEIARAMLIGDGREASDEGKIRTDAIRPIAFDDDLYTIKVSVAADAEAPAIVDEVTQAQVNYMGSGMPTLYAAPSLIAKMLVARDNFGRRLYPTRNDLAAELNVKAVVDVPVMENVTDADGNPLKAIIVNLRDYTLGADKGGAVSMFDDFDLDFNQQKYLIETRLSGALTLPKSAIAVTSPKA